MQIPTIQQAEDYVTSRSYSNRQSYDSVCQKFVKFCNDSRHGLTIESKTVNEVINDYFVGSKLSIATRSKDRKVLANLMTFVNCQIPKIPTFEGEESEAPKSEISTKSIEAQQEALRSSQILAEKQAEELEKTRLENLEKMQKLEEEKVRQAEIEAKKEAEERHAKHLQRIEERFSGFVSQEFPETFVSFDIEENIPEKAQKYFQQKNEKTKFYALLDMGKHVVLVGQAGVGKTELSLLYAYDRKRPVFKFSCSADVRKADLIGSKTITNEEKVKIVCGMITKAVLAGNKAGHAMLILDEGNALIPKVQILLQGLTDGTGFIDLPEGKLKINQGVKFNVVITMNDQYSGTNPLNKPIRNRFAFLEMGRLTTKTKMQIFEKYNVTNEVKEKLCQLDDKLDKMQEKNIISDEESMSVRSMKAILAQIEEWEFLEMPNAIQEALETEFITKFSDKEDRQEIQIAIDEIF
tara:strand:- start:838 stop:2235 length:1398 start_codon:yes stop_codon:yes gene_type:complete